MRMFRAMEASASALTAERLQMDLIANNIANAKTTRTANGAPYRRRYAIQEERSASFADALRGAEKNGGTTDAVGGGGVRISAIVEDSAPFPLVYDPTHPDADADGMVRMPNVDLLQEFTDMMISTRAYDANVTAFNAAKGMAMRALDIGR